ncbi:hypothetical protein BX616_004360 [Lobosporangium transversale]|nr:hypothetical protein BX616_004360 [Lobosporangium transversale]
MMVLAQEIIAPEEWIESVKLNQALVKRKLQKNKYNKQKEQQKQQHFNHNRHHHNLQNSFVKQTKRSLLEQEHQNGLGTVKTGAPIEMEKSPRLQKREKGSPSHPEIEHHASDLVSFETNAIVNTPAIQHTVEIANFKKTNKKNERVLKSKSKVRRYT